MIIKICYSKPFIFMQKSANYVFNKLNIIRYAVQLLTHPHNYEEPAKFDCYRYMTHVSNRNLLDLADTDINWQIWTTGNDR